MNAFPFIATTLLAVFFCFSTLMADEQSDRLRELDALWAEVSRSVEAGDFAGYKATCHELGVLVSGEKKTSEPLSQALVRWQPGFADTRSGMMKATVQFRFSQRLGDTETAHETGMFLYSTEDAAGEKKDAYIHFEALLVKQRGKWKVLMEYQKSRSDAPTWNALEK